MRFVKLFLLTAAAACSGSAAASVQVLGKGAASLCYLASESPVRPSPGQLRYCDQALNEEALLRSDVVATHVNRGILRMRLGKVEEAMSDYDRAIELAPDAPEAYLNKGSALIKLGQPGAAVPFFSQALSKQTRKPAYAYYGRGLAHEEIGDLKSAYLDYRRASSADPKWDAPKAELSRFSVRRP